ncbi:mRNA-decapping enzyme 1A [Salarias fasciatus]|uniref:5'-(N(7)-methylguanosine 5'-triphospho)-[mRNA] hydrolase n=1 Tax=Salarias fasciatus TaxID=181472 RepID=A0A672GQJ2_SALFA|nr:mRNA-decapping enzyme 1A [Salarias fasciatus]
MESANAGHMMSLAALQRQDPYINKLLDVTGQVALYNFNSKANEWEKTEIEGTLFVYARSASPHHGFTIMNRLSTENLVEPINKDLEFQLQDPFLLYRNGNLGIYSIWFYDKRDCQRIAQLMVKIVKQEADHAQRKSPERTEPGRTNGLAEPRSIDILELLSKAKEEYQRSQTGEPDVSAGHHVKAALGAAERVHGSSQPERSSQPGVKQITVEELFGTSLPKEPPAHSGSAPRDPASAAYIQKPPYPAAAHQSPRFIPQDSAPGLLPAPFAVHPGAVFRPGAPLPDPRCSASPLMAAPEQRPPPAGPPAAFLGQEILNTLKQAAPPTNADVGKPILAPSFLPSTLVPPHSFHEPMGKPLVPHGKEMDVFSQPSSLIKTIPAAAMSPALTVPGSEVSLLLSPSAFQQSITKAAAAAAAPPPAPSEPPYPSAGGVEPPAAPCSKTQLQETLIHLIKNDANFLSAIHDAYLQSLSKDFSSMKL